MKSGRTLHAAYSNMHNPEEDIEAWVETGPGNAPKFVEGYCFLSIDYIQKAIARYNYEIGDIEQSSPGLNRSKDSML